MRTTWNSIKLACGGAMALMLAAGVARGQTETPPQQSVDQQLEQSLEDDLLEGLDDLPGAKPTPPSEDQPAPQNPEDEQLLEQLDGEDLGEAPEDPLTTIARKMRLAEQQLGKEEISPQTQGLQKQIVSDLDALIKQIQKQKKQATKSGSASNQRSTGQDVQQPQQQPDSGQERTSNKPARESTDRLGQENAQPTDPAEMQALVKRVWGHLPDRARQEMQNVSVEEFLPKYRQVIEDYFRSLAEEE